jgi:hypothetical protein
MGKLIEPRPGWVYVPAEKTDILARFKKLGWVPPTEEKNETEKNQGVGDGEPQGQHAVEHSKRGG